MKAATLFSGIGAPETAMPHWQWLWHAEIEAFPSAAMAARHPGSINLGDVSAPDFVERALNVGRPDVLVFGSPCQSFSVAGKRLGLDDPRGNLALVALGLAQQLRPEWLVFENVPGLLSSSGGDDFAAFLSVMGQCGYYGAWRVLDAQYAGVPQRRRRVFFVGHFGDWRRAAAVLFEPASLCRNPAPRHEAGEGVAARPGIRAAVSSGYGWWDESDIGATLRADATPTKADTLIASTGDIAHCLNAGGMGRQDFETETLVTHTLRGDGFDASEDGTGRGTPLVPVAIAFDWQKGDGGSDDSFRGKSRSWITRAGDYTGALGATKRDGVAYGAAVRRLTPRECERLQGFPDDFTLVPYRGKPAADGPRYKSLGNSMAVPVVRWILTRLERAA